MTSDLARPHGNESLMIRDIDIRNYKCFEHLALRDCPRFNVIVGDNGSGKTALLEAIFLALGVSSEMVIRYRQSRGLDGAFRGTTRKIEEAIFKDYFYNLDMGKTISIVLGGSGPEARSVRIGRGASGGETLVPFDTQSAAEAVSSIEFQWRNASGREFTVSPIISSREVRFPETSEDLPNFFFFYSNQTYPSVENADRFSELSRARRLKKFVDLFSSEYDWIEDLTIEVVAGSPAIYASVRGLPDKLPITSISGGINRMIAVLLAIASREQSVICLDEMENGLFHSHHLPFWKALLSFSREFNSQIFLTTHNEEWLRALPEAATDTVDDIVVWRLERDDKGRPEIFRFSGEASKAGIERGVDIRGGPK